MVKVDFCVLVIVGTLVKCVTFNFSELDDDSRVLEG